MCEVADLSWENLTPSARRSLRDLAEMYHDGGVYDVEVVISQGGCRDMKLRTDPDSWRGMRSDDP